MLCRQMPLADRLRDLWRKGALRQVLPSRRGLLDVVAHASSYLLLLAFLITGAAKALHLQGIEGIHSPALVAGG